MLVRTFEDRDVGPACRITNHFIEHTSVHFGARPMSEDEFRETWVSSRDRYPWVAVELSRAGDADGGSGWGGGGGGRVVGYAKAGVWRAREAYSLTAEVSVYLDPSVTGRGLGRALYTELLARLRAAGFRTAVGGAALPNEASVRLHESLGFTYVGTFRQVGRKFDTWHDVGWWQIVLD